MNVRVLSIVNITNERPSDLNANTIIDADTPDFSLNLQELWAYRHLIYFFAWRDIKVRYKQTILGVGWAILQPFTTMVVFSIFFGGLLKVPSDGIPYPIFSAAGLIPWTLFTACLEAFASSLVVNSNLLKKIYFPRMVLVLSTLGTYLMNFLIGFIILIGMIAAYLVFGPDDTPIRVSFAILIIPLLLLLEIVVVVGLGLWLAALNVQFRDVRHLTGFIVRLWMYFTPVIYPLELIDEKLQFIYSMNPMVGIIEGFRWALLGIGNPPTWNIAISVFIGLLLLASGIVFFNRMEKTFADII